MIEFKGKGKAKLIVNIGSGRERKRFAKTVTYTTKRELNRLYVEFETECMNRPKNEVLRDPTVDEMLSDYIRIAEVRGLSANTLHGYKGAQNRINSRFKRVLAKELTAYQIENFVAEMTEKYATKTISNTIFLLNAAYERAVRTGRLESNPCANVVLPKRKKRDIKTLSPEQMHMFLKELDKQRLDYKVGYELALMCGLRRGEVLGLKEEDVNLTFKSVSVNKTRYIVENEERIQETKTDRSHRTLALPQVLANDIRALIELHHSQPFNHCDYLIQDGFGQPMSPSAYSMQIIRIEKSAGLDHVSAHGLRHTFATMLNSMHVDIAQISAELGHSNITTTLNTYTHVFGDVSSSSRGIANMVDSVFETPAPVSATDGNEKPLNLGNSAV